MSRKTFKTLFLVKPSRVSKKGKAVQYLIYFPIFIKPHNFQLYNLFSEKRLYMLFNITVVCFNLVKIS
jgi:hypothetical protein